ncbi:hypothetical protein ACA910_006684 [Epithemia clementina (nom. ined.)]
MASNVALKNKSVLDGEDEDETLLIEDSEHFSSRMKAETTEMIRNVYSMVREIYCSPQSGSLSSSITEDLMSLLHIQNEILVEYAFQLPKVHAKDLVIDLYQIIFYEIKSTQSNMLPICVHSMEGCCASANDFFRMANKLEVFCDSLVREHNLPEQVQEDGMELVATMSQTAVYAAERVQVFFIREINQTNIPLNFFSPAWEHDWTHNEVMLDLLQYLDRFLPHVKTNLGNDVLYNKVLHSSCKAIVCFYIRCLVEKADSVCRRKRGGARRRGTAARPFSSPKRALIRMQDDIHILHKYFQEHAKDNLALSRIMTNEMRMLEVIYECLAADDADSLETMVVVLHKRTGADVLVTRYFVGDLWTLVNDDERPMKNEFLQGVIKAVQPDLEMVSAGMREEGRNLLVTSSSTNRNGDLAFLRIDEMLRSIYEDRITQGILPLCWACLPKTESIEGSQRVVSEKIRHFSRKVIELPTKHKKTKTAVVSTFSQVEAHHRRGSF